MSARMLALSSQNRTRAGRTSARAVRGGSRSGGNDADILGPRLQGGHHAGAPGDGARRREITPDNGRCASWGPVAARGSGGFGTGSGAHPRNRTRREVSAGRWSAVPRGRRMA
jgi:hypothetical protein